VDVFESIAGRFLVKLRGLRGNLRMSETNNRERLYVVRIEVGRAAYFLHLLPERCVYNREPH